MLKRLLEEVTPQTDNNEFTDIRETLRDEVAALSPETQQKLTLGMGTMLHDLRNLTANAQLDVHLVIRTINKDQGTLDMDRILDWLEKAESHLIHHSAYYEALSTAIREANSADRE